MGAEERGDHVDGDPLGDPPGDAQHPQLGVEVEPVARLHLDGRDPAGRQRRGPGRRRRRAARRRTRRGWPAPWRRCRRPRPRCPRSRRPASRCSHSPARSPPNTRWVWQSTSPGVTSRPPADQVTAGRGLRRPRRRRARPRRCARPPPRWPRRPAVSVISRSHISAPRRWPPAARRPRRSPCGRRPRTTWRPATTTSVTSAAVAAATSIGTGSSGSTPASRTPSSPTAHRSAGSPGRSAAPAVAAASSAPGLVEAPAAGGQPLVQLDRAGLLEQVDDRVRVAADAQRAAGGGQRRGGADAVGQVALGGGAQAGGRAARPQQGDVAGGHVGAVHGRGGRAEHAVVVGQLGGRAAGGGQAGLVLGRLLGQVQVERHRRGRGPRRPRRPATPGSTARTLWTAAPTVTSGWAAATFSARAAQPLDVAVAEPALHRVERPRPRTRPAGSRCRAAPAGCRPAGPPRTRRRPCPPGGAGSGTRGRW